MTKVVSAKDDLRMLGPSVVTIGKFDGVHVGHQAVIDETVRSAKDIAGISVVITLWPHPGRVLTPTVETLLLTTLEDRIDLIEFRNPSYIRLEKFNAAFAERRADDYLAVLRDELAMETLVVGNDARLGHNRHAGIEELHLITRRLGLEMKVVETVSRPTPAASGLLKQVYAAGDVDTTVDLLGRLPSYQGVVGRGDGRGQELGFPTANVVLEAGLALPVFGVYKGSTIVRNHIGYGRLPAVISLGTRPTFFERGELVLEVHILDFAQDIYGCEMRVFFEDFIRPEVKFSGVAELVDAMGDDVDKVRSLPPKSDKLFEPWGIPK